MHKKAAWSAIALEHASLSMAGGRCCMRAGRGALANRAARPISANTIDTACIPTACRSFGSTHRRSLQCIVIASTLRSWRSTNPEGGWGGATLHGDESPPDYHVLPSSSGRRPTAAYAKKAE